MRILILKPSSLGDVIHALPLLRLLKRRFPASEIYWWLATELSPLLADDPDLAGLIPFDRRFYRSSRSLGRTLTSVRHMRELRFDWVIDLQGLARSGAFAWLANGDFTVGLDDHREGARGFYDLAVPRPSPSAHAVDWYLNVLSALAVPVHWNFTWLPERTTVAGEVRQRWNPGDHRWFLLCPGARWANKRWPAAYYHETITLLHHALPEARFAILGGREDQPLGSAIAAGHDGICLDLTGKTSLLEMVEWIRLGELLITNDTGPMHVAAALDKPVVALFGPTDPRQTGPYRQVGHAIRHPALPCVPCMKSACGFQQPCECLIGVKPATICAAVLARMTALSTSKARRA
ncbi:MAG: glycosyltransferase family 9 protein [Pedosphaera parvula]|nr:glycosyltransferase family 9 protein [Pedosphaera parvula]